MIPVSKLIAQENLNTYLKSDTLIVNIENSYKISSLAIIPFTESIYLSSTKLNADEYKINYAERTFSLHPSLNYDLKDTLIITYQTVKLSLKRSYQKQQLVRRFDVEQDDTLLISEPIGSYLTPEKIFGSRLKKSGSITRGINVGTNKDLSVSSGMRLQLSGRLSNEIEIVAALTDENTPIQPEGNTERLEELDKVFIQLRHKNAVGTFGDFDYSKKMGQFGMINRKLQGLEGKFKFDNYKLSLAIAGARGKFNTMKFNGTEGMQGPYRLTGANNEREIIVIAGSERVYIDGNQLKRGENNDYTIEYSNAELTFTPNILITSASRITVEFEYTDRKYNRNFYSADARLSFWEDKLNISFGFFQEGDDKDNPIDFSLTDDEKDKLKSIGDNSDEAYESGVFLAEEDSTGRRIGVYTKVDTIISGEEFTYYKYLPGKESSIYKLKFTFVGSGKGNYRKITLDEYEFTGRNKGSYLPIRRLPMPQLTQLSNIIIEANPLKNLNLKLELAGSSLDKNRFSDIDDNDNFGFAGNIDLDYKLEKFKIADINLGAMTLNYRERYIDKRFNPIDRINSIEFERDYNVDETVSGTDENLREINLTYLPTDGMSFNTSYGYFKNDFQTTNRFYENANIDLEKLDLRYRADISTSEKGNLNSDWSKHNLDFIYKLFDKLNPGVEFEYENKKENFISSDSLLNSSLKFLEIGPKIGLSNLYGFSLDYGYSLRNEYFPIAGELEKESDAYTHIFNLNYSGLRQLRSDLRVTFRKKKFTEKFKEQERLDTETVLIKSQHKFKLFDRFFDGSVFYEAASQRAAKLERVFLRVPQGTGNYKYLGDINSNGIPDENEFEEVISEGNYILTTIPSEELFPIIDLKTNLRFNLDFSRLFKNNTGFIPTVLKPLQTETFFRMHEKSREKKTEKIYLLDMESFRNDSTTIAGSQFFQQDFYLFKRSREFSLRFRFLERKSLNQFAGGIEEGFYRKRAIRAKFRISDDMSNQTEFIDLTDNLLSQANSSRARLLSSQSISSDFSYRPYQYLELGFKLSLGKIEDVFPSEPTIIDKNEQLVRLNISFSGKGRLRFEAERKEFLVDGKQNFIPFEVTNGNSIGKNYYWNFSFDYNITGNLQTNINYNGRILGGSDPIHSLRSEIRAYF